MATVRAIFETDTENLAHYVNGACARWNYQATIPQTNEDGTVTMIINPQSREEFAMERAEDWFIEIGRQHAYEWNLEQARLQVEALTNAAAEAGRAATSFTIEEIP